MPKRRKAHEAGKKQHRSSSTPGKSKGPSCQRHELKNLFCFDTKLPKKNWNLHLKACELISNMSGNLPLTETIEERRAKRSGV